LLLNRGHNNTLQTQRRGAHSSMLLPVQKSERSLFPLLKSRWHQTGRGFGGEHGP
jgi:hypothetical protein